MSQLFSNHLNLALLKRRLELSLIPLEEFQRDILSRDTEQIRTQGAIPTEDLRFMQECIPILQHETNKIKKLLSRTRKELEKELTRRTTSS